MAPDFQVPAIQLPVLHPFCRGRVDCVVFWLSQFRYQWWQRARRSRPLATSAILSRRHQFSGDHSWSWSGKNRSLGRQLFRRARSGGQCDGSTGQMLRGDDSRLSAVPLFKTPTAKEVKIFYHHQFQADRLQRIRGCSSQNSVASPSATDFAAIGSPHAWEFIQSFKSYAPTYENSVTLRSLEMQLEYEPGYCFSDWRRTQVVYHCARRWDHAGRTDHGCVQ